MNIDRKVYGVLKGMLGGGRQVWWFNLVDEVKRVTGLKYPEARLAVLRCLLFDFEWVTIRRCKVTGQPLDRVDIDISVEDL